MVFCAIFNFLSRAVYSRLNGVLTCDMRRVVGCAIWLDATGGEIQVQRDLFAVYIHPGIFRFSVLCSGSSLMPQNCTVTLVGGAGPRSGLLSWTLAIRLIDLFFIES